MATVVFKPADLVPGCAWILADILQRAGTPAGVFNLVMGKGSVVGDAIVKSGRIRAVSFTGSVPTGRRIGVGCMSAARTCNSSSAARTP